MSSQRYGTGTCTTLHDCALCCNAASVRFYHVPGNRQPQTGASAARTDEISFRACTISFVESLKDTGQLFGLDPNTGIAHKETLCISSCLQRRAYHDDAAGGREFDGVVN